jgi:hypothetical protein
MLRLNTESGHNPDLDDYFDRDTLEMHSRSDYKIDIPMPFPSFENFTTNTIPVWRLINLSNSDRMKLEEGAGLFVLIRRSGEFETELIGESVLIKRSQSKTELIADSSDLTRVIDLIKDLEDYAIVEIISPHYPIKTLFNRPQ